MIDWIKYYPAQLRQVQNAETPKGPAFSSAKNIKCIIGGSELSFKMPRHRAWASSYEALNPKSRDVLEFPARHFNKSSMPNDHWQSSYFFRRYCAFYGPWFSGPQMQLNVGMIIINKIKHQEGVSFFHPQAFEIAIADYLTSRYGHKANSGKAMWSGPVDWKINSNSGLHICSAIFNIMPTEVHQASRKQFLVFPVTDKHILIAELEHQFAFQGSIEACKKKFDSKPMEALANDIINSFSLTLGSKTQAQLDSVKSDCPDMSLSNTFAPLKWPSEAGALDNSSHENIKLT